VRGSHTNAMIYVEDVRDFLDNCKDRKPGYPTKGEVDHLSGSPPCQGFSKKNRGGKNDENNNMLSLQVVRGVDILRPRTGVLENVTGMLLEKHLKFRGKIMIDLLKYGYQVRIAVHKASDFGDPQNRQRVIFTFSRGDTPLPTMPTRTDETAITIREALLGLPLQCDDKGSGLCSLPDGTLTYNHVASVPVKEAFELDEDKPVNTILTKHTNGFVHPRNSERTLSIRELARLFSYPDDKQFFGSMTAMRKQIGNSVPVKLAWALSVPAVAMYRSLAEQYDKNHDGSDIDMSSLSD
jgi:DNA (cytosine-5)-methyltransferase 1